MSAPILRPLTRSFASGVLGLALTACAPDLSTGCDSDEDCPAERPACAARTCVTNAGDEDAVGQDQGSGSPDDASLAPDAVPGVPTDALPPSVDLRGAEVTADALARHPDVALPDAAGPDAAGPDAATLDAATPDLGTPDAATPDLGPPADARPPLPPDLNRCAPEACNGLDDDCDGATDEGLSQACGLERGECHAGQTHCVNGVYGQCDGATGPTAEVCDALDNDCDGSADGAGICKELCGSPGQPCCMGLFCVRGTLCVSLQCQ